MKTVSTVAAGLGALVLVACVPAEVREVEPKPVVSRAGFVLPSALGPLPLPSAFVGIVVTPDRIESFSGPGRPLLPVLDDPNGLAARKPWIIDELLGHLETTFEASGPIAVVWFIDARVEGKVVASLLHTASRSRLLDEPLWLATGPASAPTRVGVSSFSFREPPRDGSPPTRFGADLELYLGPVSTTAVAVPRAKDDAPNESTLGGELPRERPLELRADGSCRFSDAALRELGAGLCELQHQPYGLRWTVDVDTPYPRLLERLVDDPRPPGCVGGPLMLRYTDDNPPSCESAILLRDVLAHFAYEDRQPPLDPEEPFDSP